MSCHFLAPEVWRLNLYPGLFIFHQFPSKSSVFPDNWDLYMPVNIHVICTSNGIQKLRDKHSLILFGPEPVHVPFGAESQHITSDGTLI